MADCNANFKFGDLSYLSGISLAQAKIQQLIRSRDALREKIRDYLRDKGISNTRFYCQGSYAHQTLITPLNEDYDIDDGVYLDPSGFKTEPSTETIHNWVVNAIEGHTQTPAKDKETCVRAMFLDGYHIDLPIYKVERDGFGGTEKYYLAKKSAGWEESDPRAMTEWFQIIVKQHSDQVRRMVKYAKAWADYQESKTSTKLPNGLTMTILVGEECRSDTRDDIAFLETTRSIYLRLKSNDEIWKPYEPTENMTDYLSSTQFQYFMTQLNFLVSNGDQAVNETSRKRAAQSWRQVLGDRFPVFDDLDEDSSQQAKRFVAPAIVGTTLKSA